MGTPLGRRGLTAYEPVMFTTTQGHRHPADRFTAHRADPPHPHVHQTRPHLPHPTRPRSRTSHLNATTHPRSTLIPQASCQRCPAEMSTQPHLSSSSWPGLPTPALTWPRPTSTAERSPSGIRWRERRPDHDHVGECPRAARRALRPADDVRGRGHGQRDDRRAPLLIPAVRRESARKAG
jgi:hypothetical protein